MSTHVLPAGDVFDHEEAPDCPCGPRPVPVQHDDGSVGWVIVHYALDNRDQDETHD